MASRILMAVSDWLNPQIAYVVIAPSSRMNLTAPLTGCLETILYRQNKIGQVHFLLQKEFFLRPDQIGRYFFQQYPYLPVKELNPNFISYGTISRSTGKIVWPFRSLWHEVHPGHSGSGPRPPCDQVDHTGNGQDDEKGQCE
jgi:hypothetical protein